MIGQTNDELQKDLDENSYDQITVLPGQWPGGNEDNHENPM
jgi:hypothetical protein